MIAVLSKSCSRRALAAAKAFVVGLLAGKGRRDEKGAGTCPRLQEYADTRRRADEALRRADAVMRPAGDDGTNPAADRLDGRGRAHDD